MSNSVPLSKTAPHALRHWLRQAAERVPQHAALVSPEGTLSYAQLLTVVLDVAQSLKQKGLQPGDRIAIEATRTQETIIRILAAVEAELAYVPLDLSYPADRIAAMLAQAQVRLTLGDDQTASHPLAEASSLYASGEDLAYVLFTSGSTGQPKGVAMGQKPLVNLIDWHAQHPRLGHACTTLLFAPLSFDVHFQEIFSTVACQGTMVLIPEAHRRDPNLLRQALVTHGVTRLYLPYVALQMLAEANREALNTPSQGQLVLHDVISAGEQLQITPVIRDLFSGLPQAVLHNHYGPTESHVVTAFELPSQQSNWPTIPPIGQALPYVEIALRDPETGLVTQAEGELLLGGDCLAHGYLGQAELTADRFRDDIPQLSGRWYTTGDLVRRDAKGVLTYLGRADQQLKVDGFRIEPGEIEVALMGHPQIQDAVVSAPDLPSLGRQLISHLVLRNPGAELSALITDLRSYLRARVPEYMVPTRFMVLDRLPTTPSGKIDRRNLPAPIAAPSSQQGSVTSALDAIRQAWQELLGLPRVNAQDNVFDLGAKSLLVLRFVARLKELGHKATVGQVYDQPTAKGLAGALQASPAAKSSGRVISPGSSDGIAIVGMAVRTAGAKTLDAFWDNLLANREGIRHFAPHELDTSIPEGIRNRPNFVAARGVLEDADRFDAPFFGISAREATVLDPQQRLFLELCWTALEHASIDPAQQPDDRFGVYAGEANNTYTPALRQEQPELVQQYGEFGVMLGSEKDYIATRVANRLNLKGPAVSIHTACSTSLVAITQAWHALASGQCDVALAGGMTVVVPQEAGYLHVEGGMESADGHCRPFDEKASGTLFSSGGGVVVLKRLCDAQAAGDTIYGVIKGVGINNDGSDKASFTAPSVTGQAQAIRMALDHAGVSARSIDYVEAHGTGTSLGDPIEVAALTQAWASDTQDRQFSKIGSVKGHLGHIVAAAGAIGLIKTTLALHRQLIPGTLHYQRPNLNIDFGDTPFTVVGQATPWPKGDAVRRAGVSSFGVGGTNAHVIVEEAPAPLHTSRPTQSNGPVVWPLSARSEAALGQRMVDLADFVQGQATVDIQTILATLTRGRQAMRHRHVIVAPNVQEACALLRQKAAGRVALNGPRVVYLFPGQGSQHPGMARGLYQQLPAFKDALDRCIAIANPLLTPCDQGPADLLAWLTHEDPKDADMGALLAQTRYAQPALFCMSYALTAWLDSLGIEPQAMIGHSIGEYAAACWSGVMSLESAITAVVARGQAMFEQRPGAMLAVRASADVVQAAMPAGVEIAAQNAPALTVVAGDFDAIDAFAAKLEAQDIGTTKLKVSHAFHSASMDAALPRVADALRAAHLQAPQMPLYSCVTGELLQAQQATDPQYWAQQVRASVQFRRAVEAELAHGDTVFIEVGPSQALTALLRQYRTSQGKPANVVPLLGAASQAGQPTLTALQGLGQLWALGVNVAWPVPAQARRQTLPTYPFMGERHWFKRKSAPALNVEPTQMEFTLPQTAQIMSRIPRLQEEVIRIICDVSGLTPDAIHGDAIFVDMGLDSLSMTQATLEFERVFGLKLRFRRLMEDLHSLSKVVAFLDQQLPADQFAPPPVAVPVLPPQGGLAVQQLIHQQMQLMAQQLAVLSGQAVQPFAPFSPLPVASESDEAVQPGIKALVEKPFGASARIVLEKQQTFTPQQQVWIDDFIQRYNTRTGGSKSFSQANRKVMSDPRVVTGFNPLWKDLVYPIVANKSKGARIWDVDGNEYIDLLSCFGANLLGYQPDYILKAMHAQLEEGIEIGPQHPLTAEVAKLMSELTGMERVAFCNTGSEAVMGAMRIARTVTGRKKIAIFSNSYHGIFDEVIVRGTKQLRSLSAAPGILANAVENIIVLDWATDETLAYLREHGHELAAIMTEPIQNKYPTVQPREFVRSLRQIADASGCALIFDEVVTGFRLAPAGAQAFYEVRSDMSTYGKVIGGGLPFAAIAGASHWLDALDGGHWQYGDDSYPEAGVTYFAGTFVRHPLALAAAKAALQHIKDSGPALYETMNGRTQRMVERLNAEFAKRKAPVKAVHCASLWRLAWDENQKGISLFYYLARFHGLHLYEQFGHFVTEAMGEAETARIGDVFIQCLDELMALGFITPQGSGAPLTPGQTERWLAAAFDEGARRALNESFCVGLSGNVDVSALKGAVQDVLARHDAFKIAFDQDEPRQWLQAKGPMPIREVDLRDQSDSDAALDAFCTSASEKDFPLDQAPLAAASVLHLADGRKVVHIVASHLIFDGWASSVFNAELAAAYKARTTGTPLSLKPAESPLVFGEQEQARMTGTQGQEAMQYWREVLQNPPPLLSLGDRTPPSPRRYEADTVRAQFNAPLAQSLKDAARQRGATLFQLLLTAVIAALRNHSGQDEFVISIPYASQSLQRRGPLMADGVLDLPLRLQCQATDTGTQLLSRVRDQLMDALEYPVATQGTVARALGLPSSGDRAPFTGVFFNLNPRIDLSGFAPLTASMHEGRKRGTLSELFFNFYEGTEALTLDLHYSTEFFSPERAQSLVQALKSTCEQLAQSIDTPVSQLVVTQPVKTNTQPLVVDPQLAAWNQTQAPFDPHARIEQWVTQQAQRTPDAVAVLARGVRLSYQELSHRINRFANLLIARGVSEGDRIGLCLSRGPDMIPALLGVLKTGAAYVPLDPGFPTDRLHYMAQDAGVKWVITEAAHADRSGVSRQQQIRVDDDAGMINGAPHTDLKPLKAFSADATAYVIYTSGSTGQPKGVVLPQAAVCNFLSSMKRQPGITASDRFLAVTTLSFDIAVLELFLPLITGARVVLAQREDAMDGESLSKLIADEGITFMQATPTTWHLLLEASWKAPVGFKALCGGEPLPPSLAEPLLAQGMTLWNMYGPTETTVWSTVAAITDAKQKITIGKPIDNTQVWILDEQMHPCPVGTEGEICIGGEGVATGYFKRPELTADRFVADPFSSQPGARIYRTGDLGRWRPDGNLEHLGRLDFQVKIRGYRIELGEIEARLAAQPGVARTVVVAREVTPNDTQLIGYVTPQPGCAVDTAVLRQALRTDLPDYMVPQHILLIASMPLLPNGKIDRKSLPVPSISVSALAAAPSDNASIQQGIAHAMADVLGKSHVGVTDNFFELGGHSLLAARLAAKLIDVVGFRPALRIIFESPTPAALEQALAQKPAAGAQLSTTVIPARADQSTAPLSQMQLRLWFLETLSPGTVAHNTPSGHLLHGPLDVPAFQQAMQLLVNRQSVLRTVMERTPEGAIQRVLPTLNYALPVTDLSALTPAEQQVALNTAVKALVETPYNLEQGPLFSAHLWRLSATEHAFFFQTHHLIWDGWSFDIFYQDISELYEACRTGRQAQLPEISVSYGDFAVWHQQWLSGPELARQTQYWRDKLSPLPDPIELPLDRARPAVMSGRGDCIQFNLGSKVTRALREQAQCSGRTLYVTLLSAYALVLHQISQQKDFVVGTPVRGREQAGLEPLMGFFVNMLPMRMQIEPAQRMNAWMDQVHRMVVESFSYPEVPFEHLVRELKVPRDSSYSPIYQVSFSYQDARDRQTHWGNVEHDRMATPILGAAQDIGLWCVETGDEIEFVFTYNTDVFDASTVARLGTRIESVLHQLEAEPDGPLHHYSVQPANERDQIAAWNQTTRSYNQHITVHQLIEEQAERTPQATAIVQPGWGQLSYQELNGRANRLARVLRHRSVGRGALVGLCVERGVDMLTAQLAVLKAGAAYVPLDPSYPSDRLVYMSADAQLSLLISEQGLTDVLPWAREKLILLDSDAAEITAQSDTPLVPHPSLDAHAEDTAYVIYTSGSTGRPKGVMVPHRAAVNFLSSMAHEPGLQSSDRLLAVTTLSFDIAVLELFLPLSLGAQVVLVSREQAQDGASLQTLIASHNITVMQATPASWHLLLDAGWPGKTGFKALIGGESLSPALAEQLLTRCSELWNMYGPTETTVWSTCARIVNTQELITIGGPIANTQIHVLDEHAKLCPIGVAGEIFIGGDGVTQGYLNRPELTAERFVVDPFGSLPGARLYRTGDRGRWRPDGTIEHMGRLDCQIKVRGHRIELGEIESILATHPEVNRSVVIVREDSPGDARLVAYIVVQRDMLAISTLRDHLRVSLPDYMVPQHFEQLAFIPLLPNGKVNRHALPVPKALTIAPAASTSLSQTEEEKVIAQVWQELLGVDQIMGSDNFFDLGGHSLLAMRAVTEINRRLQTQLTVRQMIYGSLAQLAQAEKVSPVAPSNSNVPPQTAAKETGWIRKMVSKLLT
ncbi:MAG: amino acid adenylation domain-containing protein [Aquabacterium sp.]|nr:amino acid adenylation domain-containing protein [Aquabacterium sp.]